MNAEQRAEITEITVEVWKTPFMKKLLRAQFAASVSPGCGPFDKSVTVSNVAAVSLELADEIIRQVGLYE